MKNKLFGKLSHSFLLPPVPQAMLSVERKCKSGKLLKAIFFAKLHAFHEITFKSLVIEHSVDSNNSLSGLTLRYVLSS